MDDRKAGEKGFKLKKNKMKRTDEGNSNSQPDR